MWRDKFVDGNRSTGTCSDDRYTFLITIGVGIIYEAVFIDKLSRPLAAHPPSYMRRLVQLQECLPTFSTAGARPCDLGMLCGGITMLSEATTGASTEPRPAFLLGWWRSFWVQSGDGNGGVSRGIDAPSPSNEGAGDSRVLWKPSRVSHFGGAVAL